MKKLLLLLLLIPSLSYGAMNGYIAGAVPVVAAGGIAVDATSSYAHGSNPTLTWSHTVSGSDRYLFVGATGQGDTGHVTGVTYNGDAMTMLFEESASDTYYTSGWGLIAPDTGTHDIVVTYAANDTLSVGTAISLTGVHQTTATGTAVTATGFSTTPSVNVSSESGGLVIDVANAHGGTAHSVGADQTSRANLLDYNSSRYTLMSTEAGSATTTMSWTADSSWWATGAVGVKAK